MDKDNMSVPHVTRKGRVRITSPDGMFVNTHISLTDGENEQQMLSVSDLHITSDPRTRMMQAHLTCIMPELDIATEAEMELISAQTMKMSKLIEAAADALGASSDAAQHEELIGVLRQAVIFRPRNS